MRDSDAAGATSARTRETQSERLENVRTSGASLDEALLDTKVLGRLRFSQIHFKSARAFPAVSRKRVRVLRRACAFWRGSHATHREWPRDVGQRGSPFLLCSPRSPARGLPNPRHAPC